MNDVVNIFKIHLWKIPFTSQNTMANELMDLYTSIHQYFPKIYPGFFPPGMV